MHTQRIAFSKSVVQIVQSLCEVVFNIKSNAQMESLFGITDEQMKSIIEEITSALPDNIFLPEYKKKQEEIKAICAREFIFFQVQEKTSDVQYKRDLSNFIRVLKRDIEGQL